MIFNITIDILSDPVSHLKKSNKLQDNMKNKSQSFFNLK